MHRHLGGLGSYHPHDMFYILRLSWAASTGAGLSKMDCILLELSNLKVQDFVVQGPAEVDGRSGEQVHLSIRPVSAETGTMAVSGVGYSFLVSLSWPPHHPQIYFSGSGETRAGV